MRGPPPPLVALALALVLLAGCVGGDSPETPADPVAESGADLLAAEDRGEGARLGPDDGWLRFDGEMTTNVLTFEGSFPPQEAWTPAHPVLLGTPLAASLPPTNEQHDLSADIPTDMAVWITATLTMDSAAGGIWLNGPPTAFWVYNSQGAADGMTLATLVTRQADEALTLGVWYGGPETAAEVAYSVELTVHTMPAWFASSIVYGIDVGKDEVLELRFGDTPEDGAVWVWDADDTFLGAFGPTGGDVLRIVPADLGAAAGELALFVVEGNPRYQARVIGPTGAVDADVRVLAQAIANQGPWPVEGGTTTEVTYDVPVQPLQVGYSYQTPSVVADPVVTFFAPGGAAVHQSDRTGEASIGMGNFYNTDMGTPMMPPGSYVLEYSDTQNQDMVLDGWYVTYAR